MGVFKQLIKELYEWLLHSIDVATQHLVAMVVNYPTAKAIGLPRLMLGRVWFSLCVPIVGILQSLSSNAFPTGLTHHISKGVTLHTSCARYECMGI
ncbi:hypothetical protein ACR9KE_03495 [Helicobacter pylori]